MSLEASDDSTDICRICWASEDNSRLYHPCACRGSIKYVHEECLLQWLNHSSGGRCQICNIAFTFSPLSTPELLVVLVWKTDLEKLLQLLLDGIFSFSTVYMWTIRIPSKIPVMSEKDYLLSYFMLFNVLAKLSNATRIRGRRNPRIVIAVLARPATLAFGRWIFPIFGYSITINSTVSLFSRVGSLGLWVSWYAKGGSIFTTALGMMCTIDSRTIGADRNGYSGQVLKVLVWFFVDD